MQLTLEILTGERTGCKAWLRIGERMLIGRAEQAELAIPDPKMSSVHFFVECTAGGCRVHDTRSTNGTFLNGTRITDSDLHDGDVIVAGDTHFAVHVSDEVANSPAADAGAQVSDTTARSVTPLRSTVVVVALERPAANNDGSAFQRTANAASAADVPGGVRLFPSGLLAAEQIIEQLAAQSRAHLVIDYAKMGKAVPEVLKTPWFLYDWLPDKLIAAFSPVLIGPNAPLDRQALLQQAWSHNCLLCVLSRLPEDDLVKRLRQLAITGDAEQPRQKYACPEKLDELLSSGSERFVKRFFDAVDAVVYELNGGDACCVRTSPEFLPTLANLKVDDPAE